MTESKIEITERLRREGRWPEASKFKDTALADFRAKGMSRDAAAEAAWTAMAEAFPAIVAEGVGDAAVIAPEATSTDATPIPWSDLPTDADFNEEVRWVHQQYILIIEERPGSRVIHWERATKKPPSTGACSLARWAADNRTAFYKDLLPRTMAKADADREEDGELVRRERMRIEEMKEILEQLRDDGRAKLAADVPGAILRKVGEVLSHWANHHRLTLPDGAQAGLAEHLGRLVQDCTEALSQPSGGNG